MKKFNDFTKLFDEEYFSELGNQINSLKIKTMLTEDSSLSQDDINSLTELFVSANMIIGIKLLEKYHGWVNSDE